MIGFSFSPGGLLLPYHLGVLAALSYQGHLTADTPLAGSSAGAIAVASHATGVNPTMALEASMRISAQCNPAFLARGRLEPSLWQQLDTLFPKDADRVVNERPGLVGLAHLQLYPGPTEPVLQTQQFASRQALMHAVCDSSMFPYFTSNKPFRVVRQGRGKSPRITVDGVFTEPLWRFGCPKLQQRPTQGISVATSNCCDRTVCVSVLPQELVGLGYSNAPKHNNVISPPLQIHNVIGQVTKLGLLMCTAGSRQDLTKLYENGWHDTERWAVQEKQNKGLPEPDRVPIRRRKVKRLQGNTQY